jgi:hypothetical protein
MMIIMMMFITSQPREPLLYPHNFYSDLCGQEMYQESW